MTNLIEDLRKWLAAGQREAAGKSLVQFVGDESALNAGSWCIVCVGEVAGRVLKHHPGFGSEELRRELVFANAARNRVAHGYYDLDAEQVWTTLTASFPRLAAQLEHHGRDEQAGPE